MFYALDPDSDGLVHGSCRMGVRGYRQTCRVRLLDQQPKPFDRELWSEHIASCGDQAAAGHHFDHVNLSLHPLAYRSQDLVRAADLTAEVAAVATGSGDGWTGGNDPGQPVVICHCASRRSTTLKCQSPRSRTVVTPAASCRRSDSLTTASISSRGSSATRSSAMTPLSPTRWTCVSISPRKHGRIAIID